MNTFIVVVAVLLGVVGFSYQEDSSLMQQMHAVKEQCQSETNVDKELLKNAMKDGNFADDSNLKCFFKCTFVKMGRMTESGDVDFDAVKKQLPPGVDSEKITAAIDKCKTLNGADACEKAFNLAKCLRETLGPMHHDQD